VFEQQHGLPDLLVVERFFPRRYRSHPDTVLDDVEILVLRHIRRLISEGLRSGRQDGITDLTPDTVRTTMADGASGGIHLRPWP